jgi:hypothetical protein
MQIGYNTIDGYVNAVCITRTSAHAWWLLRDCSDHCEDIRLDDGPNFFLIWPYYYYAILYNAKFHKNATITLQQKWLYDVNFTKEVTTSEGVQFT